MLVMIQSTSKWGGKHWVQEGKLKKKLLLFFYKIVKKEALDYLYELVPPLVAANVNYNLRNSHNIHVPFNRLFTKILTFHVLFKHGILWIVLLEIFLFFPLLN